MAATAAGSSFVDRGGTVAVVTGHSTKYDLLERFQAEAAGSVVEVDLELPADARVERVDLTVTAAPGGSTKLASVAQVRSATAITTGSSAATVDLGRLVTVAGVGYDATVNLAPAITAVYRWTGTAWAFLSSRGSFAEVAAERLLVETAANTAPATVLQANGVVELPSLPASLELLVDGTTVWFERQGSSPSAQPPPAPGGGVIYVVDRTDAVRTAFERAPADGGVRKVRVALRAAAPGRLTLDHEVALLLVHVVQFPPEGLTRTVELAEEAIVRFDLAPPATATEVREVDLVVRGSFGPERVQPVEGPAVEPDARLALAPGRPMLLGLPAVLAGRFAELTGVRLRLVTTADGSGGEVGGRLLADGGGQPGEPLGGGELAPLTVEAGTDRWLTLGVATPLGLPPPPEPASPPVPADGAPSPPPPAAWLELQLAYGEVELALTHAEADDPVAPGAPVLRRLPGGGTAPLTTIPALGELRAAVRLAGRPDRDRPLAPVALAVARSADTVEVHPTGDDLPAVLTLAEPVRPADGPVELVATVATAGSLTLDTVRVAYSEEGATS